MSGKLHGEDYKTFVPLADAEIAKEGKVNVLAQFHDFHGWDAKALWDDIKFSTTHCSKIKRIALVGEKTWEKWMAKVCKPFTMAKVRYFGAGDIEGRQGLGRGEREGCGPFLLVRGRMEACIRKGRCVMGRTETTVAEALGQAHATLLADLQKLEHAIRPASCSGAVELWDRLGATRTHIAAHFRFEEQNGYLDAARKREPRLERAIQQLAEEHLQLMQSLDALIGKAGTAASATEPLREEIRKWIDHIRQHEVRENDLVQDAFIQDISAED